MKFAFVVGFVYSEESLENCTEYYDGCNMCSVANGEIEGCDEMWCEKSESPRCTAWLAPS